VAKDPHEREDEDKKAILSRRSRLIALALGGLTAAQGGATGCYESHSPGTPPPIGRDAGADASTPPAPCLGAPLEDAGPAPCLEVALDAGPGPCLSPPIEDAGTVEPMPCLSAPSDPDAGSSDAGPLPCLTI
jgi:hypothetical protein